MFPILIQYTGEKECIIIHHPNEIEASKGFRVVETQYGGGLVVR